jgi:small GTP-binding protein
MSIFNAKICVLGDFAVGKTSTIERFVNNHFSDKYLTTIGVKVDTKEMAVEGIELKLIIWDLAGTDSFKEIDFAYLRGAAGYVLVADGTRAQTISSAQNLRKQVEGQFGELPSVLLVNKSDLKSSWEVTDPVLESLQQSFAEVFVTSAKTGDAVQDALTRLGKLVVAREFS